MHSQLLIDGISKSYRSRRVLTDITLTVSAGERIGLIGENGSGKSTLLRIAAGLLEADSGTVHATAPGGARPVIGLLHQVAPFSAEQTVHEALEDAIAPIRAAEAEMTRLAGVLAERPDDTAVERAFAAALERAERLEAWDIGVRVEETMSGLGLSQLHRGAATGALSGGQRARLSLAWLLLSSPDVMLLDEPTNHLDDAALDHLQRVLGDWRGPVLMASHDRAFLDAAATALVDLDPSPLPHAMTSALVGDGPGAGIGTTRFTGGYTAYREHRAESRSRWEQQHRDEQIELKRLREAVSGSHQVGHAGAAPRTEGRMAKKFYADRNARVVSRRVRDARSRLEELEETQLRKPPPALRFAGLTAAAAPRSSGEGAVITARGVAVDDRLAPVSLAVADGEHWLVTGANGAGKSTLLSVLDGSLAPDHGDVQPRAGLSIARLGQEVELPDSELSAHEAYRAALGEELAESVPLGTFGLLAGRDQGRAVGTLSTGQQRRLELAIVLARPPQLLLLDEPSNHLSLALTTDLERAIAEYPGAVVIASHDRWLRRNWSGRRLEVRRLGMSPALADGAGKR